MSEEAVPETDDKLKIQKLRQGVERLACMLVARDGGHAVQHVETLLRDLEIPTSEVLHIAFHKARSLAFDVESAKRHPYDAADPGRGEQLNLIPVSWALTAARACIRDLTGRRGIENAFNGIDLKTRGEIVKALADRIRYCEKNERY